MSARKPQIIPLDEQIIKMAWQAVKDERMSEIEAWEIEQALKAYPMITDDEPTGKFALSARCDADGAGRVTCEQCGKEFDAGPGDMFCSLDCLEAHFNATKKFYSFEGDDDL